MNYKQNGIYTPEGNSSQDSYPLNTVSLSSSNPNSDDDGDEIGPLELDYPRVSPLPAHYETSLEKRLAEAIAASEQEKNPEHTHVEHDLEH